MKLPYVTTLMKLPYVIHNNKTERYKTSVHDSFCGISKPSPLTEHGPNHQHDTSLRHTGVGSEQIFICLIISQTGHTNQSVTHITLEHQSISMKFLLPSPTIIIALLSVISSTVVVHAGDEAGGPVCQTTIDANCMEFYSNGVYIDMTDGTNTRYCVDGNDACVYLDQEATANATDVCGVPMEEIAVCVTTSSAATAVSQNIYCFLFSLVSRLSSLVHCMVWYGMLLHCIISFRQSISLIIDG